MLFVCNISRADVGGGTIHFIVFADTEDASVGTSCSQTLKYLQGNFLVKLRRYIDDMDTKSYIYEGNDNFTRSKLNATIASLSTSSNDVILFYYTGHGFNNGSNDYPTLTLGRDGEELDLRKKELLDVYNTLRNKSQWPRLAINRLREQAYQTIPRLRMTARNSERCFLPVEIT